MRGNKTAEQNKIDSWPRISLISGATVTGGDLLACIFYVENLTCDRVHYCITAGLNMPVMVSGCSGGYKYCRVVPADGSQVSPRCSSERWFSWSSSASAWWRAGEMRSQEPPSQSVSLFYILRSKLCQEHQQEEAEALLHFLLDDNLHRDDQHCLLRLLHGRPRGLHQEEEEGHGGGARPGDQL